MMQHKTIAVFIFGLAIIAGALFLGTSTKKEEVSTPPPTYTISGETVCLPHREQGDFQTLECAYGIKSGEEYYAINTALLSSIVDIQVGQEVTVTGKISSGGSEEVDRLMNLYLIEGVIWVTQID